MSRSQSTALDPHRVRDDVLDSYVSKEAAEQIYGVIVHDVGNWEPTRRGWPRADRRTLHELVATDPVPRLMYQTSC